MTRKEGRHEEEETCLKWHSVWWNCTLKMRAKKQPLFLDRGFMTNNKTGTTIPRSWLTATLLRSLLLSLSLSLLLCSVKYEPPSPPSLGLLAFCDCGDFKPYIDFLPCALLLSEEYDAPFSAVSNSKSARHLLAQHRSKARHKLSSPLYWGRWGSEGGEGRNEGEKAEPQQIKWNGRPIGWWM